MKIRVARMADLDIILDLYESARVRPKENKIREDAEAIFRDILNNPDNIIFVVEIKGEIAATFQLLTLHFLLPGGMKRMQVEGVVVFPQYRNRGIGAQIMGFAEEKARETDCRMVQLTSGKDRKDAHRFYERLGYKMSHEGFKKALR